MNFYFERLWQKYASLPEKNQPLDIMSRILSEEQIDVFFQIFSGKDFLIPPQKLGFVFECVLLQCELLQKNHQNTKRKNSRGRWQKIRIHKKELVITEERITNFTRYYLKRLQRFFEKKSILQQKQILIEYR